MKGVDEKLTLSSNIDVFTQNDSNVLLILKLCCPKIVHLLSQGIKADFLSWQESLAYSLRIFADNFFVTTTTASTRCLVENFRVIFYSQRVNATS